MRNAMAVTLGITALMMIGANPARATSPLALFTTAPPANPLSTGFSGTNLIPGDVLTKGYQGWVGLKTFGFAASRSVSFQSSGSAAFGPLQCGAMQITKAADDADAGIFHYATASSAIPFMVIDTYDSSRSYQGQTFPVARVTLKNVYISDVNYAFDGSGASATETIFLAYESFTVVENRQDAHGAPVPGTPHGYDCLRRTPI